MFTVAPHPCQDHTGEKEKGSLFFEEELLRLQFFKKNSSLPPVPPVCSWLECSVTVKAATTQNSIRIPADGTIGINDSKRFETRLVVVFTPGGLNRTLSRFSRLMTSANRVRRLRDQLNVRFARTSTREYVGTLNALRLDDTT